jgi:hypothetical protein
MSGLVSVGAISALVSWIGPGAFNIQKRSSLREAEDADVVVLLLMLKNTGISLLV